MSKTKEFSPEITPAMLADVNTVLEMAKKNKYSVSKVYAAYNAVTGRNDPPQTCNSCVRNRVAYLRKWHAEYISSLKAEFGAAQKVLLEDDLLAKLGVDPIGTPDVDTTPPSDEERPDWSEVAGIAETPVAPENSASIDVIRLSVPTLELPVYFEPGDKDPLKGKAFYEGGGTIKPGKYLTSDDWELAVQPGGKATIKAAPADNDLL